MNILEAIEKMKEGKLCYYTDDNGYKWVYCLTKLPQLKNPKELPKYTLSCQFQSNGRWIQNTTLPIDDVMLEWYEYNAND